MTFRHSLAVAAALAFLSLPVVTLAADVPNDSFIAGYAAAIMERELAIKAEGLSVSDGHVTVIRPPLSPAEQSQLIKVLSAIPGVKDVTIRQEGDARTAEPRKPIEPAVVRSPTTSPAVASEQSGTSETSVSSGETPLSLYLGIGRSFEPIIADPRWPHFYASYNHYDKGGQPELTDVASVGFGETIALFKKTYDSGFRWDAGVQGGLFAIFDTSADSKDLINADYFVGPYLGMRYGNFSAMARVYHQSSHVGDEYLLRGGAEPRVNYSFETVNLLLSYDLPYGFRVYGGAGYKFDIDPEGFDPWTLQYGVEWMSPETIPGVSWMRPFAAVDMQQAEETDWDFTLSVRAGVQLEDPSRFSQRLQLSLEYFDGVSPNGQFYQDRIRYYGFGVHFFF
ncbi:MAG: DUF1207 domain-containing protein [Tepidisphaeraceae bacterium]